MDLYELALAQYDYQPYPYGLIRAMRRVFARFNIEAFVEDRTFADYRNHLDQEWAALYEEARDFTTRAHGAREVLEAMDKRLQDCGAQPQKTEEASSDNVRQQIEKMLYAIQDAEAQIEQVARLHDSGYTARIFEKLRELHTEVQSAWGTWARQVREPAIRSLNWVVPSLAIYVLLAHAVPTYFWFVPCVLLPLLAFGATYFKGRGNQDEKIREVVKQLAIFHPEPALSNDKAASGGAHERSYDASPDEEGVAARKYTIWYPKDPKSKSNAVGAPRHAEYRAYLAGIGNLFYSRIMKLEMRDKKYKAQLAEDIEAEYKPSAVAVPSVEWEHRLQMSSKVLIWMVIVLHALGMSLACSFRGAVPTYFVEGRTSEGVCVLAKGQILWPGPWEVIVGNWQSPPLTIVSRDQVVRIVAASNSEGGAAPCDQRLAAPASTPTVLSATVNVLPQSPSHKGVLVIPFAGETKVTCKGEIRGQASASVRQELKPILVNVSNALAECKAKGASDYKLPVIDVRGFASSLDFESGCDVNSDDRNRQLAEARRESVLRAMKSKHGIFDFDVASKKWVAPFATLEPASAERWTSFPHMRDAQAVRDKLSGETSPDREALSRHAEIWFLDLAGCDTFNFPSATR